MASDEMQPYRPISRSVNIVGTSVNKTYPALKKIVSWLPDAPVLVGGLKISSHVTFVGTNTALVAVVIGLYGGPQDDNIAADSEGQLAPPLFFWDNYDATNLLASPQPQIDSTNFGHGVELNVQQGIALYAAAPNDAAVKIAAGFTLWYRPK
ncbi:MAG: hypothetical protein AB1705_21515 [Verrucomicrobiota bacterium]